jgi:pyruvate dehydrogenase E2 component (dihydrolipoamide acetyltransferase)
VTTIKIPDIGGDSAEVVEILVKPGDVVAAEDSLITLEGDKSTMDVPAPQAGTVEAILVKVGDTVEAGHEIMTMAGGDATSTKKTEKKATKEPAATKEPTTKKSAEVSAAKQPAAPKKDDENFAFGTQVHAGPAVRRIATEFGVNLTSIKGSGDKGRITKEDVQQFVKSQLKVAQSGGSGGGLGFNFPKAPNLDFSKFGSTRVEPLSKIKRISGANLHRNWVSIPHITQFEDSDITELEAFRQEQKEIAAAQGIKLTPLVFIMKAVVATLKEFPIFNSSLDESGENLIIKDYYHIGVAVDTPNGLVVPVIRDVDRKGIYDLAKELGAISLKAREKGLSMAEMQGGCFTISSLGGIGGTAFTPIINAPEVAILGVSRSQMKPVYLKAESKFVPRLMLPLSLSYDHRVVDGADGARFIVALANRLGDIRKILL